MANSNGNITAPVRQYSDARAVLQVASTGLAALCNSDEVNTWSLCKPQKVAVDGTAEPKFFADQTAREAAFKKGCYGLTNIPFFTRAQNMVDWMRGTTGSTYPSNYPGMTKAESWSWRKPTVYRQLDFDKYNHKAQPPVLSIDPVTLSVPVAGTVYVDVELGYTGIRVQDLCQQGVWLPYGTEQHSSACNPTLLRLGLCFVKSGTSTKSAVVFSDKYALDESNSLSFSFLASQFSSVFTAAQMSGNFKVFLFLGAMDSMPSGMVGVSNQTGEFYPINCSEMTMKVQNQAANLTVSISGNKDTESQRSVNYSFWVQNRSTTGYYVSIEIRLMQGVGVLDSMTLGGRRYLARGGASGDIYSSSGSLDAKGLNSDLKVLATVEIYETDTATQPIDTVERSATVMIGEPSRE